jgi:nicotinate phosphoribosyltransferase
MSYLVNSALFTDLYELTMLHGYFKEGLRDKAAFELFLHKFPDPRNLLIAAGLEQALDYLEHFHFTDDECRWLADTGFFDKEFIEYLRGMKFSGDVYALPEGTAFFNREPIIRIEAPLPEAQIVETRLINIINFQTMIASKALRSRIAAPGKLLVDFGFRRAHGSEAGLLAARACCLAGFDGTSNVAAARLFDLPCYGTMAHSYIMAHRNETEAFMQFAAVRPDNLVLLIDTYDTEAGAAKVVAVADRLRTLGRTVGAVRLDSGDLADHARRVRKILDDGGHPEIRIFASSSLDEYALDRICRAGAPIDGFGIGTKMIVSDDAPFLDCAYKLQEYAGVPRYKKSEGKVTLPGRRQVFRNYGRDGKYHHDIIAQADERQPGEPLLIKVMEQGRRLQASESWRQIQERVRNQLKLFPEAFLALTEKAEAQIWISEKLESMMV